MKSINSTLVRSHLSFLLVCFLKNQTYFNLLLLLLHFTRSASVLAIPSYSAQTTQLHSIFPRQTGLLNSSTSQDWSDQSIAAGGTDPSRAAASSLLFSIPTVLLGLFLLLGGRILSRFSSSVGLAIATSFPTWTLCVNLVGVGGLTGRSSSQSDQNLAIWGLVTGTFLFGLTIGLSLGQYVHRIGLSLLSIQSGFALGVSILIFSPQLTIHYAPIRWVFLALLSSIFALLAVTLPPSIGTPVACAPAGSFLLFLGIDLLIKENSGMSLGIRFLFDHNHHHAQDLLEYQPPTVTRVLLGVSWACMLLGAAYQYKFLAKPVNFTWLHDFHRKSNCLLSQSTILIHQDLEDRVAGKENNRMSAISSSFQSHEKSTVVEGPSSLASLQHQEFESPIESEQRRTTDSSDTGLSAIPELTERSSSGRGGSRSGSGSGRGGTGIFTHSHRHPSNSTYNSLRRSTLSSEHQPAATAPSLNGVSDPSNIPVSPPLTVFTETTVFPEDSVSQAARQRLGITIYSHSGLIEEETEVMATPIVGEMSPLVGQDASQDGRNRLESISDSQQQLSDSTPLFPHPTSLGSTGLLSRLAGVFGDESTSAGHPSVQLTARDYHCTEDAGEEQALQNDAEHWAQLKDGQPPYGHAARLRRDLHSWSSNEPT